MKTAKAKLKSSSPYSQNRMIDPEEHPKLEKETADAYERRNWRHRVHRDASGKVIIPPTAFKNCIAEAAKFLSLQIPGKGKATYTKHFEAGVLVVEPLVLPINADEVQCQKLHLPADGKRGGGKRVFKYLPIIHSWAGEVTFLVLDESITESVFKQVLSEAGKFIGIGNFRPRNNGYFGRFEVESVSWS